MAKNLLTYLNLVWINDESNVIAAEAIEVGLEEPPVGVKVVGLEKMSTDTTEVVSAIEQLCGKLGAMIDAGTPPDVIIDSTRHCGRNFQNFVQKSLIEHQQIFDPVTSTKKLVNYFYLSNQNNISLLDARTSIIHANPKLFWLDRNFWAVD